MINKNHRTNIILRILNEIYPKTPIPLNHNDNSELLIAVLLSAQCTDERVNKVTPHLFKKANNAKRMMKMPKEEIYMAEKDFWGSHQMAMMCGQL